MRERMSENTMTMAGSDAIAFQPASPSASSRTSKVLRMRREMVVRTILESSMTRTRCFGISEDVVTSGRHVHDDASLGGALEQALERPGQLVEGDGPGHLLQVSRPHVAREPAPDFPPQGHRGGPGVDPEQAYAA